MKQKLIDTDNNITLDVELNFITEDNRLKAVFELKKASELLIIQEIFHTHTEYTTKFSSAKDEFNGWIHERELLVDESKVLYCIECYTKDGNYDQFKELISNFCLGNY